MTADKSLLTGSTSMLILSLLSEQDMYGYQIIATLRERSNHLFDLKAGTLYPLLHALEQNKLLTAYQQAAGNAKVRKYYRITGEGRKQLTSKKNEWHAYATAIKSIIGGAHYA